jgi:hypothetical protein
MTFECWPCGQAQRILQGRKWWFPPSSDRGESCEFMFACGLSMHQKCFSYALTNLLFGLCMSIWIIDPLVTRPNLHLGTLTRLSTPEVLGAKERIWILYPFIVFTFGLTIESIKKFGGLLFKLLASIWWPSLIWTIQMCGFRHVNNDKFCYDVQCPWLWKI